MRLTPLATTALITLFLAACGGKDESTPSAGPAPAGDGTTPSAQAPGDAVTDETPPMPTGDFRITSVTLGDAVDEEGQVRKPLETFKPGDKIYAAVVSVGSSDGLTLSAQWSAADGTPVAKAGQSLTPTTPAVASFSIAQPEPWPVGGYRVDISINDRVVESRSFQVE